MKFKIYKKNLNKYQFKLIKVANKMKQKSLNYEQILLSLKGKSELWIMT